MSAIHRSEADLYVRIAELEDENRGLKRQLALEGDRDTVCRLARYLGISERRAQLLSLLFTSGRVISRATWEDIFPSAETDSLQRNTFAVYVCNLRKSLGHDAFENVWGRGYRLTDAGRAKVAAALRAVGE